MDVTGFPGGAHSPVGESYAKFTLGTRQLAGPQEAKVLGVHWNPQTDHLIFRVSDVAQAAQIMETTKRNVISVARRFYDPLEFFTPVVLRFKLLFQTLCMNKMDWDQPLTDSYWMSKTLWCRTYKLMSWY